MPGQRPVISSPRAGPCQCCATPLCQISFVKSAHGRYEGSAAQAFLRQLRSVDFANSIVLFGASLLLSVLPFIILLSSLANHRIDTDLSRHIGLNREGARIVSQLSGPRPPIPLRRS